MQEKQYAYAVARIRTKEMSLLNGAFVEQLLAAGDEEECLRLLADKGWSLPSGAGEENKGEALLQSEREKTWALMEELVEDIHVLDVFRLETDYQNLKACIKANFMNQDPREYFLSGGNQDPEKIARAVAEKDWESLPETMRRPAEEAFQLLLHTRDGQLCDVVLDRAALESILEASQNSPSEVLRLYGEEKVAAADIKIAVRCCRMKKSPDFIHRALASCSTLSVDALGKAAAEGEEALLDYLSHTPWAEAAEALKVSFSAFEKWCDDRLMEKIRPQKYNPFTVSPLAAYVLARETELRTVRVILSGKRNSLPEEFIRERVREMYV